jgi:hypothetical protein
VGEDLRVNQIAELEGRALVGKLCGRRMFIGCLNSWMESNWVSTFIYTFIFHLLSRAWIGFIFYSKEDARKILARIWYWDNHLLCAKPCHPPFGSKEEFLSSIPT